jgi:coatomer protein complex subunit gamma
MRFGAIRALNLIAIRDPGAVSYCNTELESLISDPNRAISTAAITTLLRTGSEASIERLMQHILTLFSALQVSP